MAYVRWPGPYIVKYEFDIYPEVAKSFPGAAQERVANILVDQGWKHSFFIIAQVPVMVTLRPTSSGDCSRSNWDDWIYELKQWAPMWHVFPCMLNTSAWLPRSHPRIYTVCFHASLAPEAHSAFPDSCESMLIT